VDREDDPVERHERWLAEHEAMLRKYEEKIASNCRRR